MFQINTKSIVVTEETGGKDLMASVSRSLLALPVLAAFSLVISCNIYEEKWKRSKRTNTR